MNIEDHAPIISLLLFIFAALCAIASELNEIIALLHAMKANQ
jgi:hypothetical protein